MHKHKRPRTKYYLANALKHWADQLTPEQIHLSPDFAIKVKFKGNNFVRLSIIDPHDEHTYHYEIRIQRKA